MVRLRSPLILSEVEGLKNADYSDLISSGKLYNIFNNPGACPIEVDFQIEQPMIRVGRTNWEKENWDNENGEYLWQVYLWDGEKFVYNQELSTTPEISETEEIRRYIR